MTIDIYLSNINKRFILENATEHTFRGDLQQLIESLVSEVNATNEPKRQAVGALDYILTRKGIPVGFIEAKDIGDKDLAGAKKIGNKEQFDRYKAGLNENASSDNNIQNLKTQSRKLTQIQLLLLSRLVKVERKVDKKQ